MAQKDTDQKQRVDTEVRLFNHRFNEKITYHQLAYISPDPTVITNTEGAIYYVNPAWEKLTGYTYGEIRGMNPRVLNSGKTPKRVFTLLWKTLLLGESFNTDEIRDKKKDGSEYQIHSSFFPIRKKNLNIFYVQVQYDITRHYAYEKSIQEREERLQVLINNTNGYAIFMLDKHGTILTWNQSAEHIKGYTSSEIVGRNYSLFFPKSEIRNRKPQKLLALAEKTGEYEGEMLEVRKDGTSFWVSIYIRSIRNDRNSRKEFVIITRDITKEKELEEQKNAFIGIASHELKTPITSLFGYAQLLEKLLAQNGTGTEQHFIASIVRETTRLTGLIDDLLNVGRLESGTLPFNPESFDLNALVREVVADFTHTTMTHTLCIVGSIEGDVLADKHRIVQVLTNLLTNAIKYSPQANQVIIHISTRNDKAMISIQDFGFGISKKDQKHVFERFYRISDKEEGRIAGFGLGLYICAEILKRHNGSIWVKSEKGKGSTFSFTLDLAPPSSLAN